jgi:gamma-glutamyltranspeptidase/glutathione hydrolase
MDDFTIALGRANQYGLIQGAANMIAPGKRPLSSMTPTIVLKDGQVRMVVGSPGGSRIITVVLETILNMVDYEMAPQEAVDAPRLHLQWLPDVLYAERFALSPDTRAALTRMGYHIEEQGPWGAAELIAVDSAQVSTAAPGPDSVAEHRVPASTFYGANDPRRPSGAAMAP